MSGSLGREDEGCEEERGQRNDIAPERGGCCDGCFDSASRGQR